MKERVKRDEERVKMNEGENEGESKDE